MIVWSQDEKLVLPLMLLSIIAITLFLHLILKNKSDRVRAIPLQVITSVILVLEIIKQIRNIVIGFSPWALPFHFCSMFVFFFPLAQFSKGKVRDTMKPVAFTAALAMFALFYFNPGSIISGSASDVFADFGSFHTFTFHHLIILYLFLSIAMKNYIPNKKDWLRVLIIMSIYYVIGVSLSHALDVNYCNFLTSNIPFMESLRLKAGQVVYTISMFFAIPCGTTLLSYLCYSFYRVINKES